LALLSKRSMGPRTSAEANDPKRMATWRYLGVAPRMYPVFRSWDVLPPFEEAMQTMAPIDSAVT